MRIAHDPGLARAFALQAQACEAMDAPFTARVCTLLGDLLDDTSALGRRILGWPPENRGGDLLPIRCLGGLHALARSGGMPALTAAYPPRACDETSLRAAIIEALRREDAFLAAFLDSPPQTNEIGRSAILLGGLLTIAARLRQPIALYEIGASAGLNQLFDHWRYDLGEGRTWGPEGSSVRVACPWTGPAPGLATPLHIASRAACDLAPLDPRNTGDRERLLAFIWADQAERLARATAAFEIAAAEGTRPEKGDARDWFARKLAPTEARDGITSVLFHSVFIQYLGPANRAALVADIRARGARASPAAPFAWLRMEAGETNRSQCELRLTLWPDGGDVHLTSEHVVSEHLADVDWHGRHARWR